MKRDGALGGPQTWQR